MVQYAAFLRGVNLGPSRRVSMPELREVVGAAGFRNVRTHLQSGNLVLEADDEPGVLSVRLREVMEESFGLSTDVVVRNEEAMRAVVASNPYPEAAAQDPTKVHAVFLDPEPKPGTWPPLESEAFPEEEFRIGPGVVYLHLPNGMARARLPVELEKAAAGVLTITTRNWRTVAKVTEMMVPSS